MQIFFYLLKGTLYRSTENPNDLIEINEIFQDDNPIEARERALVVYQNYVDVLLQAINIDYENHNEARKVLSNFLNQKVQPTQKSYIINNLTIDETDVSTIEYDFDKGISLYLVMADSKTFTTFEGELIYDNKMLIHDLNSELTGAREHISSSLIKEFELYKKYGYDCKDYATSVKMIDDRMILRTPMVFGGVV
jgi:hypothetical protein